MCFRLGGVGKLDGLRPEGPLVGKVGAAPAVTVASSSKGKEKAPVEEATPAAPAAKKQKQGSLNAFFVKKPPSPPAEKEEAEYKAKERRRALKQADYVKGLDESLRIKQARLREARKKEVALDARVLQVDRQDLVKVISYT